jgi:hypothetical protein
MTDGETIRAPVKLTKCAGWRVQIRKFLLTNTHKLWQLSSDF